MTPNPANTTAVQVNLGDAPADWIVAFGMTVNSITLTGSGGNAVNLVPTASPMEMMQLMATVQPVSSAMVPFSPALTVGTSPMALNFDMNMGSSVSIDGFGNVTMTPGMTATQASASGTGMNPWQGTLQHRVGTLSSLSGSQFALGSMMGMQRTTFMTNASTQFVGTGFTGMGSMSTGMMIGVDGAMQADGTYLAQRARGVHGRGCQRHDGRPGVPHRQPGAAGATGAPRRRVQLHPQRFPGHLHPDPPVDSAFTTLTGATAVQVYQQTGNQLHGLTAVANTNDVVVRGILFSDAGT